MKAKRLLLIMLIISVAVIAATCTQSSPIEESGLHVYNWMITLGAMDDNMDKTRVSYSIDISNKNKKDIFMKSVEIMTGDKIKDKFLSGDIAINLSKTIKTDEVTQIKGEIIIDTKDMSKEEISDLAPFLTGIKAVTEETIILK